MQLRGTLDIVLSREFWNYCLVIDDERMNLMEVYGNFSDAVDRNWLTEIDIVDDETMRCIEQASSETSAKRVEDISREEVIDIETLSGRLAAALYLGDQETGAVLREMFEKDSFYSSEKLDKRYVWFSGEITPDIVKYSGFDGRLDPLAEILMSPVVTSIQEAVRLFAEIFIKPYIGLSPEAKFVEKLIENSCMSSLEFWSGHSQKYFFPLVNLHEYLVGRTAVSYFSKNEFDDICAQAGIDKDLFDQIEDFGDSIRLSVPIKDSLKRASLALGELRKEANNAGVLSVWRGTRRYMFLNVDELSVPTMKALMSLAELYGICNHTLIQPQKWLGGTKYSFFDVFAAEQCGPKTAGNDVPSAFPSRQLLDLRKKLIGAMEPGEEHCLTEIRLKDDWLPTSTDEDGNIIF